MPFDTAASYPVQGGALQWDDRYRVPEGYLRGLDGEDYELGTAGAAYAAYDVAAKHAMVLSDLILLITSLLGGRKVQSLRDKYVDDVYEIPKGMSDSEIQWLRFLANQGVQFGQSLRVLSAAAHLARTGVFCPAKWSGRMDLRRFLQRGELNPNAIHSTGSTQDLLVTVTNPAGWLEAGDRILLKWMTGYDRFARGVDLSSAVQQDVDAMATMGAIPWGGIALVILVSGIAFAIYQERTALSGYLFGNAAFASEIRDNLAEALECARDATITEEQRSACADQARTLLATIEGFEPALPSFPSWLIPVGIAAGGALVWYWWKHK